jgi:translation initiation factor IF-3
VTEDGDTLGIMDTRDAIQEARNRGVDLVEIAPNAQPPVCKIIDYGKFLYEQKKRQHEAKKKQVTVQVKEIKFRPGTDTHDYNYRMEHAREWLTDGDKVRAAIAFRGREMTHRELGAKILAKLTEDLSDIAEVEVAPKMEGYQMFTIFIPRKVKPEKKKQAAPTSDQPNAGPVKNQAQPADKPAAPAPVKDPDEIF